MNYILKDYQRTGMIRHAKQNEGKYDDFSVQDFQDAMFIVSEANSMFEELPSSLRKRFNNNTNQFLEFVQNPANKDEMHKMGILKGNDGLDINGAKTNTPHYTPAELAEAGAGASTGSTPEEITST